MVRLRRPAAAFGWPLVLAAMLSGSSARADENESNKAVATDLFDAGVRKMQEGKCDQDPIGDRAICNQARDAFKRAYALYPAGLGALRNLAYVEQNLGLIASAARDFRELMRRAPLDPNPARRLWAEFAQKEFEALAPRIPRLTIEVSTRPEKLAILLDGNSLPDAAWGTALELDPGPHTLRARAPGHASFEQSFELKEREQKQLSIVLEKQTAAAAAAKTATEPAPLAPTQEPPRKPRILPLVVAGAGVVTVAVGLSLGYVAIQKRKDACGESRFCEPEQLESGRSIARSSTIVTGIGAATLAGGLVWYFLSAPAKSNQPSAGLAPDVGRAAGGLRAYGTF